MICVLRWQKMGSVSGGGTKDDTGFLHRQGTSLQNQSFMVLAQLCPFPICFVKHALTNYRCIKLNSRFIVICSNRQIFIIVPKPNVCSTVQVDTTLHNAYQQVGTYGGVLFVHWFHNPVKWNQRAPSMQVNKIFLFSRKCRYLGKVGTIIKYLYFLLCPLRVKK